MKKFLKYYLFISFMCFLSLATVNAASITLTSNGKINYGETGTVTIKLNTEGDDLNKISFKIETISSSIDIVSLSSDFTAGPTTNLTDGKNIIISSVSGSFKDEDILGTFMIKNIAELSTFVTFGLEDVKVFSDEDTGTSISSPQAVSISLNRNTTTTKKLSSEAKLSGLKLSVGTITPAFNSSVKEYKVYNIKDTVKTLTLTPEGEAMYTISCKSGCSNSSGLPTKITLSTGKNEISITTISQDGKNIYDYSLTVYRGPTTDNSPYLSSLGIENYSLDEEFVKDHLDYTATVPYEMESININAIKEDEKAAVEIKGNNNLIVGENVITITVTSSETNEKKIYNITVTREDFKPVSTTTKSIIIEDKAPKSNNKLILGLIIGGGMLIIGLSGYFIFRKKKSKKKKTATEPKIEEQKTKKGIEKDNIQNDTKELSVDSALYDLMATKELEITKDE